MNFKTTIVLIVLLAIVGGVVIFNRMSEKPVAVTKTDQTDTTGRKLFDIASDQVSRIVITPRHGKETALEKSGGKWTMTEPVAARADESAVLNLITDLTTLHSQGRPASDVSADAGLDHPRYVIEITSSDDKKQTVKIGAKNNLGDFFYAQSKLYGDDIDNVDVAIDTQLAKAATELRDKRLLDLEAPSLKQAQITADKSTLAMVKFDSKWKIVSPTAIPGDAEEIASYLSDISRLRAVEFVDPDSDEYPRARFDRPTATVWLDAKSADPATTKPTSATTTPAVALNTTGGTTLIVGMADTLAKENYYVKLPDGTIAKVAASVVDSLKKTPLDLRDRTVTNIPSLDVKQIAITKETYVKPPTPPATVPTTQASTRPTSKPVELPPTLASSKTTLLVRRPLPVLGPELPASRPTTQSSTQPATQPVKPEEVKSTWQLAGDPANLDDTKVEQLLSQFNPLKASKYLPAATMQDALTRYNVEITLGGGQVVLKLLDNSAGTPQAICQGLTFEILSLADKLNADFHKTAAPAMNQMPMQMPMNPEP